MYQMYTITVGATPRVHPVYIHVCKHFAVSEQALAPYCLLVLMYWPLSSVSLPKCTA